MDQRISDDWPKSVRGVARRTSRRLNDIFMLTSFSVQGLLLVRDKLSETKRRAMDVVVLDHDGNEKTTTRRKKHLRPLLSAAVERMQVEYALQSVIGETEAFLAFVLRAVLTKYPTKLVPGGKKLDISVVLDSASKDEIIDRLVDDKVASTLYGSPAEYLEALGQVVSTSIPSSVAGPFAEVKATRDIVIHAKGIANGTYVKKARKYARVEPGVLIPVDHAYLRHATAVARKLVRFIAQAVQDKFGGSSVARTSQGG
ncbi:hypothetical protein AGMMS49545_19500 [Betaproteobacteria bacterium]|nr:hypothetical protein AGMMS49545_19500 [Betaproteobacteria bacterium]